jgi:hypothetical protein
MKYMMFIKHTENYRFEEVPQALFDAMGTFVEESMKSGAILDTAGLQPTSKGKRIRLAKGKISVHDGPFTEAKEVVGGYAIGEFKSLDNAMKLATNASCGRSKRARSPRAERAGPLKSRRYRPIAFQTSSLCCGAADACTLM